MPADVFPIAAAGSSRPGPTTRPPTSPRRESSVGPSLAALSANTSEPPKSPGQDWWPSSGTPQVMVHSMLRRAINQAQIREKVGRNVAELVTTPKGTAGRPSKALTLDQATAVL